jgi:hypothetical protein
MFAEGRKRFQQELEKYHRMSPAEKNHYLDERIDQMEKMRQQMAQRNRSGTGGPATFGAGPGGPGFGGSAEDRERRRKERLDQTTPEFRALMDQFRKDMNARRQQRGLSPMGPR